MSGICGYVGAAPPGVIESMLQPISYRGDTSDVALRSDAGFGYRFWKGRPGKAQQISQHGSILAVSAGSLAPAVEPPADYFAKRAPLSPTGLEALDGAFAAALFDERDRSLTLVRDPFGIRSIHYLVMNGVFYFASELKQLLALPGFSPSVDYLAIHKYLTFSFVPGDDSAIEGIRRAPPGCIFRLRDGAISTTPYFELSEAIDPELEDQAVAVRLVRRLCRDAVERRTTTEKSVGLYLSGGVDSSGVAVWLKEAGVDVKAFSLDFGARSVEREQAKQVATHLGFPLTMVPVDAPGLSAVLEDVVWKLDRPLGDSVTGPHYLLGRAAREAGLSVVFNGEGGDQFFGGWSNKPMISAALYSGEGEDETPEETYLRTYHRFYGLEEQLYTPEFFARVNTPGVRRSHLRAYLGESDDSSFLSKLRLADISLKGSQNILPRMERMSNCWGLDARAPLFDRALAEAAFRLPPQLKLHGACEKYVLKLALQHELPSEIVWRRKFGMTVPVTDWVLGPLAPLVEDVLGDAAVKRRGLFRPEYIARLRSGRNEPSETRRRRVGERLWTLVMLELWLRQYVDGASNSSLRAGS